MCSYHVLDEIFSCFISIFISLFDCWTSSNKGFSQKTINVNFSNNAKEGKLDRGTDMIPFA